MMENTNTLKAKDILNKAFKDIEALGVNLFFTCKDCDDFNQILHERKPISTDENNIFINTVSFE